jgi:hypothetical protein
MIMGKVRGLPTNTDLGTDFSFKSLRQAVEAFDLASLTDEGAQEADATQVQETQTQTQDLPVRTPSDAHSQVRQDRAVLLYMHEHTYAMLCSTTPHASQSPADVSSGGGGVVPRAPKALSKGTPLRIPHSLGGMLLTFRRHGSVPVDWCTHLICTNRL